jgi:arabinan endo-1,5-alpha-L-arabinosidase
MQLTRGAPPAPDVPLSSGRRVELLLVWVGLWVLSGQVVATSDGLRGELGIHDPSTIVVSEGRYWVFGTGRGVLSRWSTDLGTWQVGPPVFSEFPSWRTNVVSQHPGRFWAPDVVKVDGRYLLYYSVSSWGSRESAIGLATNATLNPGSTAYRWRDCGPVIRTTSRDEFNAIDPSVLLDRDGRLWMAFGSFWSGIKLIELDPGTGLRLDPEGAVLSLAWKAEIEAACLYRRGDHYYLFVNWGHCCRGVESTYEIRVGRSSAVTGPYLDREGVDLLSGGGSRVLGTVGRRIGPGHAGVLDDGGITWFSYHYYDGEDRGRAKLEVGQLGWDAQGWPEMTSRPAGGPGL